jgi:hypothetical protein
MSVDTIRLVWGVWIKSLLQKLESRGRLYKKVIKVNYNKTLAKRLLELKDLQNICVFSVLASRFKS